MCADLSSGFINQKCGPAFPQCDTGFPACECARLFQAVKVTRAFQPVVQSPPPKAHSFSSDGEKCAFGGVGFTGWKARATFTGWKACVTLRKGRATLLVYEAAR